MTEPTYKHFSLHLCCFDSKGKVVADAQRIFDLEISIGQRLLIEELDVFIRRLDAGNGEFTTPSTSSF